MSRKLFETSEQLEGEVEKRTQDIAMLQRPGNSLGACSSRQEASNWLRNDGESIDVNRYQPEISR